MKPINPKPLIQDDFEDAIQLAINQVKQSKWLRPTIETLQIKETEIQQHLSTLLKLELDTQEVEQCKLAGKCLKSQGHYVVSMQRNAAGFLERKFAPCPLLDDQLKVSRYLIYDDFNPEWKDSKLIESLKQREGQKALYVYFMKVFQKQTRDGLALIGPHQSGKSFGLGIFAYRYALNELGTIGLLDVNAHLPRLITNKKMDMVGFHRELERLQKLNVLILDGFGSQPITEDMLTDVLIPLFIARQKPGLITMVSSTAPILQLEGLFKGYKDKRMLMADWLQLVQTITKPIYLPALMPL